ncbi:unnamed protein product [Linum tenue]|uniref:Palmitoyltransferase n=1 Tax=Linum tenue TaxID=586396 RepID=A0AAV0JY07_9ROSI|nr:unnamed protein product [Linum tenue]CAI0413900.1 unnamed protein product [Linum tenue]
MFQQKSGGGGGGSIMALNVFKFCTFLRALGSIMIFFVVGVIGLTYYVIVVENYGPALFNGGLDSFVAFLVLLFFHAFLVMLVWSYFTTILTDPGGVPQTWRPITDEEEGGVVDPLVGTDQSTAGLVLNKDQAYEKKTDPRWRYDLGRMRNFEQVFGTDKRYWLIPAYAAEDLKHMPALHGLEYPIRPNLDELQEL